MRDFYYKLEEKIDPMERVSSASARPNLTLFYSPQTSEQTAAKTFEALLTRQRRKHTLSGWYWIPSCPLLPWF